MLVLVCYSILMLSTLFDINIDPVRKSKSNTREPSVIVILPTFSAPCDNSQHLHHMLDGWRCQVQHEPRFGRFLLLRTPSTSYIWSLRIEISEHPHGSIRSSFWLDIPRHAAHHRWLPSSNLYGHFSASIWRPERSVILTFRYIRNWGPVSR